MLIVSPNGAARHYRDGSREGTGHTPLRVEPEASGYALVQYDFGPNVSMNERRRVLGMYGTEREAEQAAVAFADGPPKAPKPPRKSKPQTEKAKRVNALAVGTAVSKTIRRPA